MGHSHQNAQQKPLGFLHKKDHTKKTFEKPTIESRNPYLSRLVSVQIRKKLNPN